MEQILNLRISRGDGTEPAIIRISNNSTLSELRRAIWEITGVPWYEDCAECQRLIWRGEPIATHGSTKLKTIGIEDGDVIDLIENPKALKRGMTYMNAASEEGVRPVVRRIIEQEVPYPKHDFLTKLTPLHSAVMSGHQGIAEDLVGIGENVDAVDTYQSTPLYTVLPGFRRGGRSDAMEVLGAAGADYSKVDNHGLRPIHVAAMCNAGDAICRMAEWGADASIEISNDGMTALHCAVMANGEFVDAIDPLMSVGANVSARSRRNYSRPIDSARQTTDPSSSARYLLMMGGA